MNGDLSMSVEAASLAGSVAVRQSVFLVFDFQFFRYPEYIDSINTFGPLILAVLLTVMKQRRGVCVSSTKLTMMSL